jgi:hypothetical protein
MGAVGGLLGRDANNQTDRDYFNGEFNSISKATARGRVAAAASLTSGAEGLTARMVPARILMQSASNWCGIRDRSTLQGNGHRVDPEVVIKLALRNDGGCGTAFPRSAGARVVFRCEFR